MKSIKRILTIVLTLAMVFTTVMGTFSVSAAAGVTCSQDVVVVDDDFAGQKKGTTVSATVAGTKYTGKMGTTAFATVEAAYAAVAENGSIYVAAGVYTTNLAIERSVFLYGNNKDVNPNNALDASQVANGRAATGADETILQNSLIYYKALGANDITSGILKLTVNGFAVTGDSAIYLCGERYRGANVNISYNVFDIINENAYSKIEAVATEFSAIQAGSVNNMNLMSQAVVVENNRIERVGYTGNGYDMTNAIEVVWATSATVSGNYIANTTNCGFTVSQLQTTTTVTGNYVYNVAKNQLYDNIGGEVEVSDNIFDTVGTNKAEGQWALGIHATASSNKYSTSWLPEAKSVLIHSNTFKNLGNALFLRGQFRDQATTTKMAPIGAEIYNNMFYPANENDCNFITMQSSDGSYAPKVYDNYTAGISPDKVVTILDSVANADFDFGRYWLNEQLTKTSEVLSVTALTNTVGVSLANAKIQVAPVSVIAADIPNAISEIELGLEVVQGAYYSFYEDAQCTVPLVNNTVVLKEGSNTVYAKVNYENYSTIYTLNLTRKAYYSDYMDPEELVVSADFAQYAYGQTVYVQVGEDWRRAIVGYTAFGDIASAVAAAQKGTVINLPRGVYDETIYFNKGVTYRGAKAGINPNNMSDPEYSRNPQRTDLSEETVFTMPLAFDKGVDGIEIDGITMTEEAQIKFDDVGRFTVNGMTFKNILFVGLTSSHGTFYRMALAGTQNTMSNIVFKNNRYEGKFGGNTGSYAGASNALFEGNVFHNNTGRLFFGCVDGAATDVLTFKDNIFYKSASYIDFGNAGGNPHANASMKLDGNRFIDCNANTLVTVANIVNGVSFTVENNRFEGTTKARMSVSAKAGFSGQTIAIRNNYFGPGVTELLINNLESTADCTYNYYANGLSSIVAGKAKFSPYYINEAMTILSGDYQLLGVNAPEGAKFDAASKTVTYTSNTVQEKVAFDLAVSAEAKYGIYADKECTIPYSDNAVVMAGQKTIAYVKVSTADGELSQIYTIQVNQPKNNKAEIKGMDVEGSTWVAQGANRFSCTLPNNYVKGALIPLTSAGASVFFYEADDTEMKTPINYTDVFVPVGQTTYIVKVVSEDESQSNVYTIAFNRSKNSDCELLAVDGEEEFEIDGNTVTITYPFAVEKITPKFTVSEGATYAFYEDIGANIRKTGDIALKIGENKVYVKVTAEDGTNQMYTILMTRQDRSSENTILVTSFPDFTNSQEELNANATGNLIGLKYISGSTIYLQPKKYIDSVMDTIQVSEGASYDIFKDYDFNVDLPVGAALSTSASPKQLKLAEGENIFYIRVTAANGRTAITQLIVQNEVKVTEAKIVGITDFTITRNGNEIAATRSDDAATIEIKVSNNATVKVFADRKKTVEVPSSMTAANICTLTSAPKQSYVKYYVDVTSQTGVKESYVLTLTAGSKSDKFSDISGHWAETYINEAYKMGITSGTSSKDGARTFTPGGKATRQEVAIFICNLMGIDAASYENSKLTYKDAASISSWATTAVKAVTKLGIFSGDGTNFHPKNAISRQEFMAVIVRACALDTSKSASLSSFKDTAKIAKWAKVYVRTAVAYGLVSGDHKGNLNPTASVTRAEIAKIMVCAKEYAR